MDTTTDFANLSAAVRNGLAFARRQSALGPEYDLAGSLAKYLLACGVAPSEPCRLIGDCEAAIGSAANPADAAGRLFRLGYAVRTGVSLDPGLA